MSRQYYLNGGLSFRGKVSGNYAIDAAKKLYKKILKEKGFVKCNDIIFYSFRGYRFSKDDSGEYPENNDKPKEISLKYIISEIESEKL